METTEQTGDAFGTVLAQALRLNPKDQERLGDLMNRVARADGRTDAPVDVSVAGPSEVATATDAITLEQWLQSLADLAPWQRFQLIEDAIEKTEPGTAEGLALVKARRELLNDNPTLNLRLAVQRAAAEHPGRVVGGLIGLLLAIGTLGHGLFRLIF